MFRLKHPGFFQHLFPDVLANRRAPGPVNIKPLVGKMEVLAPVECGEISRTSPKAGPVAHPAGRPGMGVNNINLFIPDDLDQPADIQEALNKAPVVNGNGINPRLGRVREFSGGDPNPVAPLDLPVDDRRRGGFGSRHKIPA